MVNKTLLPIPSGCHIIQECLYYHSLKSSATFVEPTSIFSLHHLSLSLLTWNWKLEVWISAEMSWFPSIWNHLSSINSLWYFELKKLKWIDSLFFRVRVNLALVWIKLTKKEGATVKTQSTIHSFLSLSKILQMQGVSRFKPDIVNIRESSETFQSSCAYLRCIQCLFN